MGPSAERLNQPLQALWWDGIRVTEHATRSQQSGEVRIDATQCWFVEPVESIDADDGVVIARDERIDPALTREVGRYDADSRVVAKDTRCNREKCGIHVNEGGLGVREPSEQPYRDAAGPTRQVKDAPRWADRRLDEVEDGRNPLLTVGKEVFLLAVPAGQPGRPIDGLAARRALHFSG
jgi:hypothetical protein